MDDKKITVRRGWKPCVDPKACKIFKEVVAECRRKLPHSDISGLDETLYVKNNVRPYGECKYTSVCGKHLSAIMINGNLLAANNTKDIRSVLVHEVAHAAAPIRAHHNSTWKRIGDTIGEKWNITVQRTDDMEVAQGNAPYVLRCSKCGMSWIRARSSAFVQHPERFHHGRCPIGTIKLIRIHGKEVV